MEKEYWRDTSSKEQRMRSGRSHHPWKILEKGWWHWKNSWTDSEGFFPESCEDFFFFLFFFFVNKYKIEEDTPNWCCRRTLLLNLLGRVIVRKYVTFLRRHLLASKLNLSKRITVSALAVFLAVLKVLLTQLTGIPRCTESLVKTDRGWDLNKTSLVTRFLSEPHKNPK